MASADGSSDPPLAADGAGFVGCSLGEPYPAPHAVLSMFIYPVVQLRFLLVQQTFPRHLLCALRGAGAEA